MFWNKKTPKERRRYFKFDMEHYADDILLEKQPNFSVSDDGAITIEFDQEIPIYLNNITRPIDVKRVRTKFVLQGKAKH